MVETAGRDGKRVGQEGTLLAQVSKVKKTGFEDGPHVEDLYLQVK